MFPPNYAQQSAALFLGAAILTGSKAHSFFGFKDARSGCKSADVATLFGIAASYLSSKSDAEHAAFFIRNMSKAYTWQADKTTIMDLRRRDLSLICMSDGGDLTGDDPKKLSYEIFNAVTELAPKTIPVFVGGDHSVTYPILSSLVQKHHVPVVLVVFDHHLDIQYWGDALDPLFNTNVMSHVAELSGVSRIVHIGVNPFVAVPATQHYQFLNELERAGTQIPLGSSDIDCDEAVLGAIPADSIVYLSVDVDVLCRAQMSATGYPSDTGMTLQRLLECIDLIAAHRQIIGCDVVEFAAKRDDRRQKTLADAGRATQILLSMLFAIAQQSALRSAAEQTVKNYEQPALNTA